MGDLSPAARSALSTSRTPSADTPQVKKYLPPIMRKGVAEPSVTSLDFSSPAFPTLGNPSARSHVTGGFKQKILDLLEKEALDEIERLRFSEIDIRKMSKEDKIKDGGWEFVTYPRNRALPPLSNTD